MRLTLPALLLFSGSIVCLAGIGCGKADPSAATSDGAIAEGAGADSASGPAWDLQHPVVVLKTSEGSLTIELDMEHAPGTATNFVNYVNSGHYDGTLFHYVEQGTMALGGGFTQKYELKPPLPPIRNEAHNGVKNVRGTIAMSRYPDEIDSATCQFFINLKDNAALDHRDDSPENYGYCVFGRVTAGLDVAERIATAKVQDSGQFVSTPRQPILIETARLQSTRR